MRPSLPARRSRTALVLALTAVATLAGCAAGGSAPPASSGSAATDGSGGSDNQASSSAPAPTISISPRDGSVGVRLDSPISVTVDTGTLDSVAVRSDVSPVAVLGQMDSSGTTWTSSQALDPKMHYTVEATAHDSGGTSSARAQFATLSGVGRLTTDVFPGDGSTVGIGMPIVLKFSQGVPPARQAAFLQHIQVQSSTPVEGAWHWFGDQEVHWRPRDFWPSGTKVTVLGNLRGVEASDNVWGLGNWSATFTIGEKHYSVIDTATHQMQVFKNDQLFATYPVSAGKPSTQTLNGTLFVWYKLQQVRMVSTSIGIPVNAAGGYDQVVYWDTAISTDGFYIHSAPWSVWAQGSQNVSHGCVNLSEARAIEFFKFSQIGDVVVVQNSTRPADYSDGEADWQIPFDQYANTGQSSAPPTSAPATSGGGI